MIKMQKYRLIQSQMCVKYRLINAQLITALVSRLFIAMNAIQMYLLGGVEY